MLDKPRLGGGRDLESAPVQAMIWYSFMLNQITYTRAVMLVALQTSRSSSCLSRYPAHARPN